MLVGKLKKEDGKKVDSTNYGELPSIDDDLVCVCLCVRGVSVCVKCGAKLTTGILQSGQRFEQTELFLEDDEDDEELFLGAPRAADFTLPSLYLLRC